MSHEQAQCPEPDSQAALDELRELIHRRYPTATFTVARGEDPEGFYLKATVDLDDVDEVIDEELLDRLFDIQVEQSLPVYVIPLQPLRRVLESMDLH